MNIFVFDTDPNINAQQHCDKHVVKMPLETAQILCTVLHEKGLSAPYKPTHRNHPCVSWAGKSKSNFIWTIELGLALCLEYQHRYGRIHKSQDVLFQIRDKLSKIDFEEKEMTPFALAVKPDCLDSNPVVSYRKYFLKHKQHLASWRGKVKGRNIPSWFEYIVDETIN